MTRKPLSKRIRFEVFKRDSFVCQYCGAHPPAVTLHVDHIIAVSSGGRNDMDNLVTACDGCNLGKSNIPLDVIPKSLKQKSEEVREREAQIAGYAEIMEARRQRIDDDCWRVAEELEPGAMDGYSRQNFQSIKRFVERLGVYDTLDAAEISAGRGLRGQHKFRYFCAVCWGKIREMEAAPKPVSAEDIKNAMTEKGGWTRETLAGWGIPWPPPEGWKESLIGRAKKQNAPN